MCYGSQTMRPMSCGPKCYNGFIFSPSTWNAVRACLRNFYGNADAIALLRSSMMENPSKFRATLRPFLSGDGVRRKMARVELTRKFDAIEEKSEAGAQEIIEDDLTLDRTYFVSYVTFWERLSTTAANQKFDQLLEQQQRMHCEGGADMVSYPDVRRRRRREGVEARSGVVERTGIDEAEYTVKRKRLYGKQSVSTTKPLEQSRAMVVVVRDAQVPTGDDAPEPSEHGLAGAAGRDEVKQATPNEKGGRVEGLRLPSRSSLLPCSIQTLKSSATCSTRCARGCWPIVVKRL